MKAPSVREGSKENRTQVTKNRICKRCLVWKLLLLGQAPIQHNRKYSRLWLRRYGILEQIRSPDSTV